MTRQTRLTFPTLQWRVDCSAQRATLDPIQGFIRTAPTTPTQAEIDTAKVNDAATASFPYTF